MPCEGKNLFGLHFLHHRLPFDVLVARMSNVAMQDLTGYEWAIQLHPEPFAKLNVIRQCTPDPRNGRLEFDSLLNTIIHIKQPPGCIICQPTEKSNLLVALCNRTM